jgi:hypothetical protein
VSERETGAGARPWLQLGRQLPTDDLRADGAETTRDTVDDPSMHLHLPPERPFPGDDVDTFETARRNAADRAVRRRRVRKVGIIAVTALGAPFVYDVVVGLAERLS